MAKLKWNQFKDKEHLYDHLEIAFRGRLANSRKHKAYFLFSVLFSKAHWLENNVSMVRNAVLNNTLYLIGNKLHPNNQNDDNIDIYFLEDEKGEFFIVLVYNPYHEIRELALLDIIPVKTNDYQMTQIYPIKIVKKGDSSGLQKNC